VPHWGFVCAQLTTNRCRRRAGDGRGERSLLLAAGHNVRVDADAEIVMFSPQHEHNRVINHMIDKVKG